MKYTATIEMAHKDCRICPLCSPYDNNCLIQPESKNVKLFVEQLATCPLIEVEEC